MEPQSLGTDKPASEGEFDSSSGVDSSSNIVGASDVAGESEVDFANDGRVDRLTGLDAPEIFYLMLEREIASLDRRANRSMILMTFTLKSRASVVAMATQLITLAQVLRKATRAEDFLSRLGRMTFVVVLGVEVDRGVDSDDSKSQLEAKYSAITKRYSDQVKEMLELSVGPDLFYSSSSGRRGGIEVERSGSHSRVASETGEKSAYVDIDYFERRAGESLLDLLERAKV